MVDRRFQIGGKLTDIAIKLINRALVFVDVGLVRPNQLAELFVKGRCIFDANRVVADAKILAPDEFLERQEALGEANFLAREMAMKTQRHYFSMPFISSHNLENAYFAK